MQRKDLELIRDAENRMAQIEHLIESIKKSLRRIEGSE